LKERRTEKGVAVPKLVNLRGTSGSGKSYLVRTMLDEAKQRAKAWYEWMEDGRKRPLATEFRFEGGVGLLIPGPYDTPCGGCDTIKTVDRAYELVGIGADEGLHVLYEGIMIMDDVRRAIELSKRCTLTVIGLTTPLSECLAAIEQRRLERGDERTLDPTNTQNRYRSCARRLERLHAGGVNVLRLNREEALVWCRQTLLSEGGFAASAQESEGVCV
jgi:hypothetical protein